jgi:hypothetical protein
MQPGPGGFNQASAGQKTIVAGVGPQIMGGQFMPGQGGQGPGQGMMMPPPGYPQGPPGPVPMAGANKTVMLPTSEGVVSVARSGPAPGGAPQGASTLFWIVSLVVGVAVGALAYAIVLQL